MKNLRGNEGWGESDVGRIPFNKNSSTKEGVKVVVIIFRGEQHGFMKYCSIG